MKREFYVSDAATNVKKGITPSSYHITIEDFGPVVTKTGMSGGMGVCCIISNNGKEIKRGEAICIPRDRFDFKYGSRLALKRAMTHLFSREQRALFWTGFWRYYSLEPPYIRG